MRQLVPWFVRQQSQQGIREGQFPASALFVDISGYTALTETLMQHQKDGAEVLSEALGVTFGALVKVIHDHAGIISLFAGDAVTAIFPPLVVPQADAAHDCVARAVSAAFAIRSFFHPEGTARVVHTKYGDFNLSCKIGLASGEVSWGIVGTAEASAFYFRGEAVTGCAEAEQRAVAGEILAAAALASEAAGSVQAEALADEGYVRLTACSLPPHSPRPADPAPTRAELAPFVPANVLDLTVQAEFREICVAFVIFQEPPTVEALHAFVATVQDKALAYGGLLNQIEFGDKGSLLLLLFGAPVTHENIVERTAQFLIALRHEPTGVTWRAGVTYGTVWAGFRGGAERWEYGAVGDVMNLAARLAVKAPWEEIWTSAALHDPLHHHYRMDTVGAIQFKGKQAPTQVYRLLGGATSTPTAAEGAQMVGRTAELEQLEQFLAPIFTGQFAGAMIVYGEAGMGKSRLVDEVRRRQQKPSFSKKLGFLGEQSVPAAAARLLWLACPADEVLRQSLNPFKHCLRTYFQQSSEAPGSENRGLFAAHLAALLAQLPATEQVALELRTELERTQSVLAALVDLYSEDSLYARLEPRLRYENTLMVFKLFVRAVTWTAPLVLAVDDIQWLDADSRELLHLLTSNVEDVRFAVICTARYLDNGEAPTLIFGHQVAEQRIDLRRLDLAGVRLCAEQVLQSPMTPATAEFLATRTNGNPFFVEQLTKDLHERSLFVATETEDGMAFKLVERAQDAVPTSITAVLISRLDRLTADIKGVVQTAAVIGREFDVPVLNEMLPEVLELQDKVDAAATRQIWQPTAALRYGFLHILLRDAAYDMQLRARLRQLHQVAAGAIEHLFAPDLAVRWADLAYHYRRAELPERERTYARLAGERAASQFANSDAITLLTRTLELTPTAELTARYDIYLLREAVYDHLGARQPQAEDLAALDDLVTLLADPRRQTEVLLRRANYADAVGDYANALAAITSAIQVTEALQDVTQAAIAHRLRGKVLWRQGEYPPAGQELEHALQLARATHLPAQEADCLLLLGMVAWSQGQYGEARNALEASLAIARANDLQDRKGLVLNSMGLVAIDQHDFASAQHFFAAALEIARETGNRSSEGYALNNLGGLSLHEGQYGAARSYFTQYLRVQREIDDRQGQGIAYDNLGTTARRTGDYGAAQQFYEQAIQVCQQIGDRSGAGMLAVNLARLALGRQAYAEADTHGQRALALTRQIGDREGEADALTVVAHAQAALGQQRAAATTYAQVWELRQQLAQPDLAMVATAGLAEIALEQGQIEQALHHVESILAFLEADSLQSDEDAVTIYLVCYYVLAAVNDPRARALRLQAEQLLQERAARIEDPALRRSFLENIPAHRALLAALGATTEV